MRTGATKPYIDMSDALLDPTFADYFTVNRRTQVVGANGVPVVTITPYPNTIGVVTSASPNDLERLDDNQRMGRNLVVVTQFRLRGPAPGFMPDTIVWNGDTFVVKQVDPYPQYGFGFVQAIIGSMDLVDQPTPEA